MPTRMDAAPCSAPAPRPQASAGGAGRPIPAESSHLRCRVKALRGRHWHCVAVLEMRVDLDPFALGLADARLGGFGPSGTVAAVETRAENSRIRCGSRSPLEAHAHAFAWRVADEGVREHFACAVTDVEGHLVRDIDAVAENIPVADVAGFGLGIAIQAAEGLGRVRGRGGKGIVLGRGLAGVARIAGERVVAASLGVFPAIEYEVAVREDLGGDRVCSPVQ